MIFLLYFTILLLLLVVVGTYLEKQDFEYRYRTKQNCLLFYNSLKYIIKQHAKQFKTTRLFYFT